MPHICDVCRKELAPSESTWLAPSDHITTCFDHIKYRNWNQVWMARKDAGFPYEEPKHECQICFSPIDDEHFDLINQFHALITCRLHIHHSLDYNLDRTRHHLGMENLEENTKFLRALSRAVKKQIF